MWRALSNRLDRHAVPARCECALALSVEEGLAAHVVSVRRQCGAGQRFPPQLDPHITVLFGGVQPAAMLLALADLAARVDAGDIDIELDKPAVFTTPDGLISNLHFRLRSDRLLAMHRAVLRAYLDLGLPLQTPYVGEQYVAHLSVLDRIGWPAAAASLPAMPAQLRWRAGACQLIVATHQQGEPG